MCAFLFVCFGSSSSISLAPLLHSSVSSSSGSAFISSILQLLCFFIHPFSRSSRSCVSPSSSFSVRYFIHPLAPLFLHPFIHSLLSFLCFSILWLLCYFIYPATPLFLHPSSRSLSFFFLFSLARFSRSSVLRRACSEELRLLLVFGSVECLASEL